MPKNFLSATYELYYIAYSAFVGRELRRQSCVCLYVITNLALYCIVLFGKQNVFIAFHFLISTIASPFRDSGHICLLGRL